MTTITSTFDANADGWTVFGDVATFGWQSTGGLPGGHLEWVDSVAGNVVFYSAPSKFLGAKSLYYGGSLSYALTDTAGTLFADNDVRLVSPGLTLNFVGAGLPGTSPAWNTITVGLTQTGWVVDGTNTPATEAQMRQVLSNLTNLYIRAEFVTGAESGGLDNVTMTSPPFEALLSGNYWSGIERTNAPVFVTYSFPTSAPASHTAVANQAGFNVGTFQAFSAGEQAIALAALQQWANASGIVLLEVAPGQGQINFAKYDLGPFGPVGSGGFAFNPFGTWNYTTFTNAPTEAHFFNDTGDGQSDGAGDVFINSNGTVTLGLMLHEIGHALGLKHPFETGNNSTVPHNEILSGAEDNTANTVMSYTGPSPTTLGTYDIAAISHIYGTNAQDGTQVQSWSWNPATFTLTQTGFAGTTNTMLGISTADIMTGGNLADRLVGFAGNDSLSGGGGDDLFWGGRGDDTMRGGSGSDRFYVDFFDPDTTQSDVIADFEIGTDVIDFNDYGNGSFLGPASFEVLKNHLLRSDGSGNAILNGIFNGRLQTVTLQGISVNSLSATDFAFVSFGPRTTTGTSGNDQLWGGLDGDTLTGGDGADFFAGDAGNDSLSGGNGTDRFDGGAGADTFNGGAGLDRVDYNVATTLILNASGVAQAGSSSEALGDTFVGIEHIRGSALDDNINVSTAVGILAGFGGNDTLTGGSGTNEINGDDGNDVIHGGGADGSAMVGDVGGTRTSEVLNGGNGNDTIFVETLSGQVAYVGGDAGADTIVGGAGADVVDGGADGDTISGNGGNDVLNGGTGADTVDGGDGNDTITDTDGAGSGDTYIGGTGADGVVYATGSVFDFSAPGADVIDATIEYVRFVNAATVTGSAGIDRFNGTGNNADNFSGLGGNDWLVGFGGNDTLDGGADNDRLDGGLGADTIRGGSGSDYMTGGNAGTTSGDGAADTFYFGVSDINSVDAITDFEVGVDKIGLDSVSFGLGAGALSASRFMTLAAYQGGAANAVTGDVFAYDVSNGYLYWDAEGSVAGGLKLMAILTNHAAIGSGDFVVL